MRSACLHVGCVRLLLNLHQCRSNDAWLWSLADAGTKPVTAAEVRVPGQAFVPKYAHPGSFKPVRPRTASEEQDSPVLDAEFTEVKSSGRESGEKTAARRRRRTSKRR